MKVFFYTNLDLSHAEEWPKDLPTVPCKGDYIQSKSKWKGSFQLRLEVVDVTWRWFGGIGEWVPEIELHIRRSSNMSITDFYKWYAPKVGRQVSSFI